MASRPVETSQMSMSGSAHAKLLSEQQQDPLTVNINVTFNEVNFSSEEDNIDVPDELDYNKRLKLQQELELNSDIQHDKRELSISESGFMLSQQASSIKAIQEKLALKKREQRDKLKAKTTKNLSNQYPKSQQKNNQASSFYTATHHNTRQSSKVFKLPTHDKSMSSNQADYYRSIQNTPLKMSSPSNRSTKPRGDVINLATTNTKLKKPIQKNTRSGANTTTQKSNNLHNQSLKSILDQTKKFVPAISSSNYGTKQHNDWSRASFTPMSTKQRDNPWINFNTAHKARLVSTPRQPELTPIRNHTPNRFPASNIYQNIPSLRTQQQRSSSNRVAYRNKNNTSTSQVNSSTQGGNIFDRLVKDNDRRIATKKRIDEIKRDNESRSVSPINRTSIVFHNTSKLMNTGDMTMDDYQQNMNFHTSSNNITPKNRGSELPGGGRFAFTDTRDASAQRSKSPYSRVSSRSRRQQDEIVNRFKDQEHKRLQTIQQKAYQKLQETLEEIKRAPFSGSKLDLSKEQQDEIVKQVVRRLQYDNECRQQRAKYTTEMQNNKNFNMSAGKQNETQRRNPQQLTNKSNNRASAVGGQGNQGSQNQKLQMIIKKPDSNMKSPSASGNSYQMFQSPIQYQSNQNIGGATNQTPSNNRYQETDIQYQSLQQLVREEIEQVRQGYNFQLIGKQVQPNQDEQNMNSALISVQGRNQGKVDLAAKSMNLETFKQSVTDNEYMIDQNDLGGDKTIFSKRFSEQIDTHNNENVMQTVQSEDTQNVQVQQQPTSIHNDSQIHPYKIQNQSHLQASPQQIQVFEEATQLDNQYLMEYRSEIAAVQTMQINHDVQSDRVYADIERYVAGSSNLVSFKAPEQQHQVESIQQDNTINHQPSQQSLIHACVTPDKTVEEEEKQQKTQKYRNLQSRQQRNSQSDIHQDHNKKSPAAVNQLKLEDLESFQSSPAPVNMNHHATHNQSQSSSDDNKFQDAHDELHHDNLTSQQHQEHDDNNLEYENNSQLFTYHQMSPLPNNQSHNRPDIIDEDQISPIGVNHDDAQSKQDLELNISANLQSNTDQYLEIQQNDDFHYDMPKQVEKNMFSSMKEVEDLEDDEDLDDAQLQVLNIEMHEPIQIFEKNQMMPSAQPSYRNNNI